LCFSQLQKAIEDNERSLVLARLEQQERNMNQILREEQDQAYQESLKADQEKERRKQEEKKRREDEEKSRKKQEVDEIRRREKLIQLKLGLADKIPKEPEPNEPDSIRILIKLPNGTRLERRFLKTDSIKYLYYFVFCHDQSPLQFQIITNFPRKELPGQPPTLDDLTCYKQDEKCEENLDQDRVPPNFNEIGLRTNEMLFVHDLEA
jgi:FAS-associated factor 2